MAFDYKRFCVTCVDCQNLTNKTFARANGGKCKSCATGVPRDISNHPLLCPDCREHLRTPYQKAKGYRCDSCVSQFDRETNYAEVRGDY